MNLFALHNVYFLIIIIIALIILIIYVKHILIDKKQGKNSKLCEYKIDNKLFFDSTKFEIFDELKLNWKIIQQEAKYVLENSPKLNISRTHKNWNNSSDFVDTIIDKYGWIRAWNTSIGDEEENENGNYDWLNYGLFFNDGLAFTSNVLHCPQTFNILEKIKDKINIAGFSYMKGNSMINKHTDSTGISTNSLAFHLGLIVPEPYDTCQLIVNDGYNDYYFTEKPGETVIFDSNHEHYAYNKSSEDRVILYIDFKL